MGFASASRPVIFALILAAGFAAAAAAEDAAAPAGAPLQADPAVTPPDAPQNPLPGTPPAQQSSAPDPVKDPQSCLAETGDYVTHGNAVTYLIGLENKCDKRLKCKINAYVVGARGPASAEIVMILGAASSGAAAKKSYPMKVKAAGGIAQVSRDCRVF